MEPFPMPFDESDSALQPLQLPLQDIMSLSRKIREKQSWFTKMLDPAIRSKWAAEAEAQNVAKVIVDYVFDELEWFIRRRVSIPLLPRASSNEAASSTGSGSGSVVDAPRTRRRSSRLAGATTDTPVAGAAGAGSAGPGPGTATVEDAAVYGTYQSDDLVEPALLAELLEGVAPLEAGPPDYHPGSKNQVIDLVHPSLHPFVKGVSRELPSPQPASTINDNNSNDTFEASRPSSASASESSSLAGSKRPRGDYTGDGKDEEPFRRVALDRGPGMPWHQFMEAGQPSSKPSKSTSSSPTAEDEDEDEDEATESNEDAEEEDGNSGDAGAGDNNIDDEEDLLPPSANLLFAKEQKEALRAARPELTPAQLALELGQLWIKLPSEERAKYQDQLNELELLQQKRIAGSHSGGGGPATTSPYESKLFQWLPAEFAVGADGRACVESYINNLHPGDHAPLYATLAVLVERFVPLWERVLSDLRQGQGQGQAAGRGTDGQPAPWWSSYSGTEYPPLQRATARSGLPGKVRPYQPDASSSPKSSDAGDDAGDEDQGSDDHGVEDEEAAEEEAGSSLSGAAKQKKARSAPPRKRRGGRKAKASAASSDEDEDEDGDDGAEDVDVDEEDSGENGTDEEDDAAGDKDNEGSGGSGGSGGGGRRPHFPPPGRSNPDAVSARSAYGEDGEGSENSYAGWHQGPAPVPKYVPRPLAPPTVSLRGRKLQVIVKLASIVLTPDRPSYPAGSWHVEGMLNERIVASGIYYYACENTRSLGSPSANICEPEYEQNDNKGVERTYGIQNEGTLNQPLGSIITQAGRCIAFPNIFQHQVQPFKLADPTKRGVRKILVFFLVDPGVRVLSTARVPPQQLAWMARHLAQKNGESLAQAKKQAAKMPGVYTIQRAHGYRTKLMKERKYVVDQVNSEIFEREFSLCEH